MALTRIRAQQISNIDYKQAVRVVTTTNVTLTGGAPNSVDGVALSANSRVLVNGQSTATQNGLYLVQTLGTGSNGTWIRTTDTNDAGEMQSGMVVTVTEGNTYRDTLWTLTTDDPIVLGSSNIAFQQSTSFSFGNISANGTAILANTVGDVVTLVSGNNISITGNATAKTVTFGVTGIQSTSISNGTSNVQVVSAGGDVTVGIAGVSNVAVFGQSGLDITGNIGAVGNINGNNISTPGLLSVGEDIDARSLSTSLGISANTTISAIGNLTAGNISTGGIAIVTGNITGGNIVTAGQIIATGNLTGSNISTAGILTVTGNITSGNISTAGNITGSYFFGNGSQLSGIITSVANINNGTSNVAIDAANANITMAVAGTANVIVVSTNLVDVTGNITASGNVTGSYFFGNGSQLSGIITSVSNINNGTSNVSIDSANANVTVGVNGTANIAVFSPAGVEVTGNLTTTGNIVGGGVRSTTSSTPPSTPSVGDVWYNTNNNILYRYTYDGASYFWEDITGGSIAANSTAIINGNSTAVVSQNGGNIAINIGGTSNTAVFAQDRATFAGNLLPSANVTYSLGSTSQRWKDLWISNSTIYLGDSVLSASGNVLTVGGEAVITSTNANTIDLSGNITGGNITTAGNITGAYIIGNGSQLTGLAASYGNANVAAYLPTYSGNVSAGNVTATGNISGSYIIGNGSQLTGLPASYGNANVASYLPTYTGNVGAGNVTATGNISGSYIIGNGSQLTGLPASYGNANVASYLPTYTGNVGAGNITVAASGTASAGALVATNGLILSNTTVTANYTVPVGQNALSIGPMAVANNISVAVSNGQRWVII
jgi:hypothetical protein